MRISSEAPPGHPAWNRPQGPQPWDACRFNLRTPASRHSALCPAPRFPGGGCLRPEPKWRFFTQVVFSRKV